MQDALKLFGNIFITFIGAGILGLPYAFKEAGILEGAVVMAFVAFLSIKAMFLVIDCKYKILSSKQDLETLLEGSEGNISDIDIDYGEIGQFALGRKGKLIVEANLCVSQVGFCCAYIIFITENVTLTFPDVSKSMLTIILLSGWMALNLLRTLKSLSVFSIMADFATLFAYVVVFWFDFEHFDNIEKGLREESLSNLPFFMGIAMYCYEGAGMILSLESSVPSVRQNFKDIFSRSICVITVLYIVFGICGYMSFGHTTEQIITLNLPSGPIPGIVRFCLSFSLFFTFPVMMFPVVKMLDKKLHLQDKPLHSNAVRISLVLCAYIIICVVPNFSILMAFVGATCCTLLGFILPALFHLVIFQGELTINQKIWDFVILLVGVWGSIISTIDALGRMYEYEPDQ